MIFPPSRFRPIAAALAALAALALAGCLATPEHKAAYANLCSVTDARGWKVASVMSASRPRNGTEYWEFGWLDDGSRDTVRGPLEHVYRVLLSAGTVGSGAGEARLPMVYDPRGATLRIAGREVPALPRLWVAQQDRTGLFVPARELPGPANLNAPDIPFPGWFYLAFPGGPPGAHDRWQIDGGSMALEEQPVPLPVGESCVTPSRTWMAPAT